MFPGLVEAVVVLDPVPMVMTPEFYAALEGLAISLEKGEVEMRSAFVAQALFREDADPQLRNEVVAMMSTTPAAIAAAAMRAILQYDGLATAKSCRAPILHIAADPPTNPIHQMEALLPAVINRQILCAGHFNHHEQPKLVNQFISAFFEKVSRESRA
ncbi:hypothetical protein GCM10027567_18020 [Spongiibacter taiwanensis]